MDVIQPRAEYVGKKIIVKDTELEINLWKSGFIRCSTIEDDGTDLMLLVEWVDQSWEDREWVRMDDFPQVFIESQVSTVKDKIVLVFAAVHAASESNVLIEFFNDNLRDFVDKDTLTQINTVGQIMKAARSEDCKTKEDIMNWINLQRTQQALLQYENSLPGIRVLMYGINSTVRWINALITGHGKAGRLQVLNEQVLTPTIVDPREIQVMFLDPNMIIDILDNNLGVYQRRSRRGTSSANVSPLPTPKRRSSVTKRKSLPEILVDKPKREKLGSNNKAPQRKRTSRSRKSNSSTELTPLPQ
uniref:Uncharacterized protein n=1 Tax=Ciona savignyi TaxID=51511 RepID=H2YCZ5_CIOSA